MALEQIVTRAIGSAVTRAVNTAVQKIVAKTTQQLENDFADEHKAVTTSGFNAGITMKYFGWPLIAFFGICAAFFGFIFYGNPDKTFSVVIPGIFLFFFILFLFLKKFAKKSMYVIQFNYRGIWIFNEEGTFLNYIDASAISARNYRLNKLRVQSETGKKYRLLRVRGENWDSMTELFNQFHVI